MLFSSSFIHILAPFLPISTIYRRQSFHCSVNLPCNTTPHSRYVYNRSRYCILNLAWAVCVLRNEPPMVVALDLATMPHVQKALDRCLPFNTNHPDENLVHKHESMKFGLSGERSATK